MNCKAAPFYRYQVPGTKGTILLVATNVSSSTTPCSI